MIERAAEHAIFDNDNDNDNDYDNEFATERLDPALPGWGWFRNKLDFAADEEKLRNSRTARQNGNLSCVPRAFSRFFVCFVVSTDLNTMAATWTYNALIIGLSLGFRQ